MKQREIINYWIEGSKTDLDNFKWLYRHKRYYPCLFFGHLVIEKVLKALVISETKNIPPYTHDLNKLVELSKVTIFSETDIKLLKTIGKYNIEARYPDIKENTEIKYDQILQLYEKICNKVLQ